MSSSRSDLASALRAFADELEKGNGSLLITVHAISVGMSVGAQDVELSFRAPWSANHDPLKALREAAHQVFVEG